MLLHPTDYSSYVATYKEEAGNARFERGLELLDQNNKASSREAYNEFQKALALKPGDLSIKQKIEEAYANAVTNVIIRPLTRYGFQYSSYNFDYQNFNYNVLRYLNNNSRSQFVRYYSTSGPEARMFVSIISVDMRFSDVNIGRYRDQRSHKRSIKTNSSQRNSYQKRFRR